MDSRELFRVLRALANLEQRYEALRIEHTELRNEVNVARTTIAAIASTQDMHNEHHVRRIVAVEDAVVEHETRLTDLSVKKLNKRAREDDLQNKMDVFEKIAKGMRLIGEDDPPWYRNPSRAAADPLPDSPLPGSVRDVSLTQL
jgi:hypothetical protein